MTEADFVPLRRFADAMQAQMAADATRHEEQQMHLPLSVQNVERLVDTLDQVEVGASGP